MLRQDFVAIGPNGVIGMVCDPSAAGPAVWC